MIRSSGRPDQTRVSGVFSGALTTAAAALLALGCGDTPSEPNGAPTATITAPSADARFLAGESVRFEGSGADPEDGSLTASALVWTSDRDGQFGTGASFTRTDLSLGTHRVTLVATDSEGASDAASLMLTIDPPPEPGYQIDVRFIGDVALEPAERELFEQAARRWEEVIVGDLPELVVQRREPFLCDRVEVPELDQLVDDLIVYVELAPLDGPNNWIGWGAPCILRESYLPAVSDIVIDIDDRSSLDYTLALHELGHAIGFGEVWDELGLLRDPAHPDRGLSVIEATEDASVSSAEPNRNLGLPDGSAASEHLVVGADLGVWSGGPPDGQYRSLVRFDLTSLTFDLPIRRAFMQLVSRQVSGTDWVVEMRRAASAWEEATVTWNTWPGVDADWEWYFTEMSGSTYSAVVGDVVRQWLSTPESNHGFTLAAWDPNAYPDFTMGLYSRHAAEPEQRPRLYIEPDTHFGGPAAIAAFDSIGGADYAGGKVPVENSYLGHGDSVDAHWREGIMSFEVMSSSWPTSKISAVTVGALVDMGYEVEYAAADAFSL